MSISSPAAPRGQLGTWLQAALALLALGAGLLGAAGWAAFGLFAARGAGSLVDLDAAGVYNLAWASLLISLPAIPALIYSGRRLFGRPPARGLLRKPFLAASLALVIFPLALALGRLSAQTTGGARFLFPLAAGLAAALPIWWAVELARKGIAAGGPQRIWGALNVALYVSTPLLFVLEMLGLVALVILIGIWAAGNPELMRTFSLLQTQIMRSGGDLEALRAVYAPIFRRPAIIFAVYAGFSVVIPLLEELLKPLAVWFLLGRRPSPAAGLALGAVCGAGFALAETLLNLVGSGSSPQWVGLAIGRAGTGLLHVGTAALTGMAIAAVSAAPSGTARAAVSRGGKILHLALAYAAAVALHGLWNALSITSGLASVILEGQAARIVSVASAAGLVGMSAAMIALLFELNRRLRPAPALDVQPAADRTILP